MRFRKYEPLFHLLAISYPLLTAIYCAHAKLFNPSTAVCWIQTYPLDCETSDTVECIRGVGANVKMIRLVLSIFPPVVNFTLVAVSMTLLTRFVNAQALRTVSYSSRFTNRRQSQQTQRVFTQSCWYVGAFLVVWLPTIIHVQLMKNGIHSFASTLFLSFFLPLQGWYMFSVLLVF